MSVGWSIDWLVGWLVDWLIGWLVGWLVDWLIGWLVGWLEYLKSYLGQRDLKEMLGVEVVIEVVVRRRNYQVQEELIIDIRWTWSSSLLFSSLIFSSLLSSSCPLPVLGYFDRIEWHSLSSLFFLTLLFSSFLFFLFYPVLVSYSLSSPILSSPLHAFLPY